MLILKSLESLTSKQSINLLNKNFWKNVILGGRDFWGKGSETEDKLTYEVVTPGKVQPSKCPPENSSRCRVPGYVYDPKEADYDQMIVQDPVIWKDEEIDRIRQSCKIASNLLHKVKLLASPGTTTESVDAAIQDEILKEGAYPSLLGFKGFPKSIAMSVNNVAVHGVPDDRPLKEGDVMNVDIAVFKNGYHGLCSGTFVIGEKTDKAARHLVSSAYECLHAGISVCAPGVPFSHIGNSVAKVAKKRKVGVASVLVGHGLGSFFHGPPDIHHVPNGYPGAMKPGMVFTIEPCITEGSPSVEILEDGFTISTRDKSRAAQFEHTVLVTETGVEILSLP